MFKKLRNRFLIVNLATISVMMLAAFATIYIINYLNVRNDINMDLQRITEAFQKPGIGEHRGGGIDGGTGGAAEAGIDGGMPRLDSGAFGRMGGGNPPPERSISFMIETDNEWKQTGTPASQFSMDDEFYAQALQEAVDMDTPTGRFELDGSLWAFESNPTADGHMLVFLDITARQKILTNLIYTFTLVGLVMLVILFFTSRYFANRSIKPVQEAFDKQKQFIADASHELKTPLAIINTNADVLLANGEDTILQQSKWLHYIKSETARMAKLTNDLLYLTEMDDSRTGMIHAPFNISEAVENIILTMEAVIFEKNVVLEYDIEPDLTVHGNSEQIKQVVMILLDNAVKYTGPKGEVTLSLRKQHNDVLLSVTNTGEGIAPEHLNRIFDRFYRTDTSRARKLGGHGLGLAIAKSIVEQHHKGKIYAKSVVGESATFYVQLG
ncbi:two-component sensor histidine kinase [Paenibacillus sp. PK3_47]|uniref:sensor histidine kinase n=1 Tax=Paenibacillus sp. PK3_47 TaxID=2072642 RepID=UPI00201D386B|nr:HAMP domain-containing sensor histidine kinase [Paenibacillus sp. PK3_47]UQZ34078.1 two-component sensor histidine kinase [Paenibacillus sp. PK3_47]